MSDVITIGIEGYVELAPERMAAVRRDAVLAWESENGTWEGDPPSDAQALSILLNIGGVLNLPGDGYAGWDLGPEGGWHGS